MFMRLECAHQLLHRGGPRSTFHGSMWRHMGLTRYWKREVEGLSPPPLINVGHYIVKNIDKVREFLAVSISLPGLLSHVDTPCMPHAYSAYVRITQFAVANSNFLRSSRALLLVPAAWRSFSWRCLCWWLRFVGWFFFESKSDSSPFGSWSWNRCMLLVFYCVS